MSGRRERRSYARPRVVSERVFEQAALACGRGNFHNDTAHLKTAPAYCGYHSS